MAVSVQDTSVVLGQPYVGGAGIVSGQMYQFRGISLYQLIRGSPSVESTFMTANSQGMCVVRVCCVGGVCCLVWCVVVNGGACTLCDRVLHVVYTCCFCESKLCFFVGIVFL